VIPFDQLYLGINEKAYPYFQSIYEWLRIMDIQTTTQTEFIDITDRVRTAVKESGIADGICVISTRHTTSSIMINENERGLKNDLLDMLEKLIPENKKLCPQSNG